MFKKVILLICLMVVPLSAIEFETKVGFAGSSNPSSFFYKSLSFLPAGMDLAFGMSSIVPFSKSEELDVDLNLGLRLDAPILGKVTSYFTFDNHDGVERTGEYDNSDFYTKSFSVAKTWMYPLTDQLDMGITAVLGSVLLNGEYQVYVLPSIFPVVSMTIDIL